MINDYNGVHTSSSDSIRASVAYGPSNISDPDIDHLASITSKDHPATRKKWRYTSEGDGPGLFICPSGHIAHFHIDDGFTWTVLCQGKGLKIWLLAPPTADNIKAINILGLGAKDNSRIENVLSKLKGLKVFITDENDTFIHRPGAIHAVITGNKVAVHVFFEVYHIPTVSGDIATLLDVFRAVRERNQGRPLSDTSGGFYKMRLADSVLQKILRSKKIDSQLWENAIDEIFGSKWPLGTDVYTGTDIPSSQLRLITTRSLHLNCSMLDGILMM